MLSFHFDKNSKGIYHLTIKKKGKYNMVKRFAMQFVKKLRQQGKTKQKVAFKEKKHDGRNCKKHVCKRLQK